MWTLNGHGRGRAGTHQGRNGMGNHDLAKIGTLLENRNREMEIWGWSSMPFTHGLKLLPTPGPAGMHPLSPTSPGRESTGEIINNTVALENSIPANCCSALFKSLVRAQGAVGKSGAGVLRPSDCLGEGVGKPGETVSILTPALPPLPPPCSF